MADDFTTFSGVEAVLGDTADYAVNRDLAAARRRATALERKLDFAASSSEQNRSLQFDQAVIQSQLEKVYAFIRSQESVSESDRLRNPDVVHADFSTFGQYRDGNTNIDPARATT